jgi:hypothetical protein
MTTTADVLIVTATRIESLSVLAAFEKATGDKARPVPIGNRVYQDLGELNQSRVFMALTEMGSGQPGASQQAVQKGIEALHPAAAIMIGIAFGINRKSRPLVTFSPPSSCGYPPQSPRARAVLNRPSVRATWFGCLIVFSVRVTASLHQQRGKG